MVTILTVKCPHCEQISDVHLSTNAGVVILDCPQCSSPVMYFDDKIYLLSAAQIEVIRKSSRQSDIMRLLREVVELEAPYTFSREEPLYEPSKKVAQPQSCSTAVSRIKTERQQVISSDDLTNLRIELELCTDSGDFIDRL